MAEFTYAQLQTDYLAAGGVPIPVGRFLYPLVQCDDEDSVEGDDSTLIAIAKDHPKAEFLVRGMVIGFCFEDGAGVPAFEREVESTSESIGAGAVLKTARCVSVRQRARTIPVTEVDADGYLYTNVPVVAKTPAAILAMPLLSNAPHWLVAGTVTPTAVEEQQFEQDNLATGLAKMEDADGYETQFRMVGKTQYAIDRVRIGALATFPRINVGRNLRSLRRDVGGDQVNRVTIYGADGDDGKSTLAWAFFKITAVAGQLLTLAHIHDETGPLGYNDQFNMAALPYTAYLQKADGTYTKILATRALTQQIGVVSTTGIVVGQWVRIVTSSSGRHLSFLDAPPSPVAVPVGFFDGDGTWDGLGTFGADYEEFPRTRCGEFTGGWDDAVNILENPLARVWPDIFAVNVPSHQGYFYASTHQWSGNAAVATEQLTTLKTIDLGKFDGNPTWEFHVNARMVANVATFRVRETGGTVDLAVAVVSAATTVARQRVVVPFTPVPGVATYSVWLETTGGTCEVFTTTYVVSMSSPTKMETEIPLTGLATFGASQDIPDGLHWLAETAKWTGATFALHTAAANGGAGSQTYVLRDLLGVAPDLTGFIVNSATPQVWIGPAVTPVDGVTYKPVATLSITGSHTLSTLTLRVTLNPVGKLQTYVFLAPRYPWYGSTLISAANTAVTFSNGTERVDLSAFGHVVAAYYESTTSTTVNGDALELVSATAPTLLVSVAIGPFSGKTRWRSASLQSSWINGDYYIKVRKGPTAGTVNHYGSVVIIEQLSVVPAPELDSLPPGWTAAVGVMVTKERGIANVITADASVKVTGNYVDGTVLARIVRLAWYIHKRKYTFSALANVRLAAATGGGIGFRITRSGVPVGETLVYRSPLGPWRDLKIEGLSLLADELTQKDLGVELVAVADVAGATVTAITLYVDSLMLSPTITARPILEGAGAARNWQDGQRWMDQRRETPVSFAIEASDFERAGIPGTAALTLGATGLVDEGLGLLPRSMRIMRRGRDLLRSHVTRITAGTLRPRLRDQVTRPKPPVVPFFESLAVATATRAERQTSMIIKATLTPPTAGLENTQVWVNIAVADLLGGAPTILATVVGGGSYVSGSGSGPWKFLRPAFGAGMGRVVFTAKLQNRQDVTDAVELPELPASTGFTVRETFSETDTTGTLIIVISDDPGGKVTGVKFATQSGNAALSAYGAEDTSVPYTSPSVAFVEKQPSKIAYQVMGTNSSGTTAQVLWEGVVTLKPSVKPAPPIITASILNAAGDVALKLHGDYDTSLAGSYRYATSTSAIPADATVDAASVVTGSPNRLYATTLSAAMATIGTVLYIKAVAYSAASGGGAKSDYAQFVLRRDTTAPTKTIRIPFSAIQPRVNGTDKFNYDSDIRGGVIPAATGVQYEGAASIIVPKGVTLTAVRGRFYRQTTSDYAEIQLFKATDATTNLMGGAVSVSTGWHSLAISSLNQLVGDEVYMCRVFLKGITNTYDARLQYLEADYTVPSYENTY